MSSTIEVLHGSALDFGAEFFAEFHTQISDLPYSPHVHANCASVGVAGGGLGAHDRDLEFEALTPELLAQAAVCAESVKRWTAIYSDVESTHLIRAAIKRAEYIRPIPWIRWSQPQLSGDRPCTILEIVSVFHAQYNGPRGGVKPLAKHWNGPGNIMPNVSRELLAPLTTRAMRGQEKHPTEKGIDQALELVSWLSDPGENVIDLTAGSCVTGLACRLLDRDCVCIELREDWARQGAARVKGNPSPRDRARAEEWCENVYTEATETIATSDAAHARAQATIEALTVAGDTTSEKYARAAQRLEEDRNTRERAERRLGDVERVMVNL